MLFKAASVPIKRHRKIKGEANPYDAAWEPYFEERLGVKMEETLVGKRRLLALWKEQGGICPVCRLACPSSRLALPWRQRRSRQPGAPPPELPQPGP